MAETSNTFFEGAEKKIECILSNSLPSLRNQDNFWKKIVEASDAKILSKISSSSCEAFLLSESSLFVFDKRFIMSTCGTTRLINGILEFMTAYNPEQIAALIYERKNEHFPHYQHSNFLEDAMLLSKHIPGKAYQFGDQDSHHVFVFHMDKQYKPAETDLTLEILMHGINDHFCKIFSSEKSSMRYVHTLDLLKKLFPGFQIDDYFFNPAGYSLNAVKDSKYYSIHVTPQKLGSYISFETNYFNEYETETIVENILKVFQPDSSDIMLFQNRPFKHRLNSNYLTNKYVSQELSCGYNVQYVHYFSPTEKASPAIELSLTNFRNTHE